MLDIDCCTSPAYDNNALWQREFPMSRNFYRGIGAALTGLAALFLLMDAAMKLLALPVVLATNAQLGYPGTSIFARCLGALLLLCTFLYLWPRTALLGAVLLTGYLGGAIAAHIRIASP